MGKLLIPLTQPKSISRDGQTVAHTNSLQPIAIVGQEKDIGDLLESLDKYEIVGVIDIDASVGTS